MTFEQLWQAIRKYWRFIVVCCLAVGLGASLGSRLLISPRYQSTALVQIAIRSGNGPVDVNNLTAGSQLIQTEALLVTSDPVLKEVATRHPGVSVDDLKKDVTATPISNTQIFSIDVQTANPALAAVLANDVANTLVTQQRESQGSDFLVVAQPAQPSGVSVRPNILLNTGVGLVVGLLLGVLFAILRVQLNGAARLQEFLASELGWPVLATLLLPISSRRSQADSVWSTGSELGQVVDEEGYRKLRASIGFLSNEKTLRTLVMACAVRNEEVSSVAANLALFMVRTGKRVLLVDADMREPGVQRYFDKVGEAKGLSDAILAFHAAMTDGSTPDPYGRIEASPFIDDPAISTAMTPAISAVALEPFMHQVDVPNLWVMPAGTAVPNPAELLDSAAMHWLFEALLKTRVETILFIAPPLLNFADASVVAAKVDGTLLVIEGAETKREELLEVKTLLRQADASIAGCVMLKRQDLPDGRGAAGKGAMGRGAIYKLTVGNPASNPRSVEELSPSEHDLLQAPDAKMSLFMFEPTDGENTVKMPAIEIAKERRSDNG